MDSFVSHLASDKISPSVENQKAICTTLYNRILALQKYDALSLSQIRSPIILLKPTQSSVHTDKEDYGLSKVIFLFLNIGIFKFLNSRLGNTVQKCIN